MNVAVLSAIGGRSIRSITEVKTLPNCGNIPLNPTFKTLHN